MAYWTSNDKSFVSIVIPWFNRSEYINPVIDSIHKYADLPYEIIVHDDNSTDPHVVKQLMNKNISTLITHKGYQLGLALSSNRAISLASSEYIVFINADCVFKRPFLKDVVNVLNKPYVGWIGLLDHPEQLSECIETNGTKFSLTYGAGSGAAMAFRKSTFDEIGGFDPDVRSGCFPHYQTVITDSINKPISELDIGELVLTNKKRYKPIINIFKRKFKDFLVSFKSQNKLSYIDITSNHKLTVFRLFDKNNHYNFIDNINKLSNNSFISESYLFRYGEFITVCANELEVFDYTLSCVDFITESTINVTNGKFNYYLDPICNIQKKFYDGYVYNIQVMDDSSYTVSSDVLTNVLVLNCSDSPIQFKMWNSGYFRTTIQGNQMVENISQSQKENKDSTMGKTGRDCSLPKIFGIGYSQACIDRWNQCEDRFRQSENNPTDGDIISNIHYWQRIGEQTFPKNFYISKINWSAASKHNQDKWKHIILYDFNKDK